MNSSINEPVYSTLGPIADNLLRAFAPPANRTLIPPAPQSSPAPSLKEYRKRHGEGLEPLKYGLINRLLSTVTVVVLGHLTPITDVQRSKTTKALTVGQSLSAERRLATQTQTTDQSRVTLNILGLQVVQQLTTLVYHPDQTTT